MDIVYVIGAIFLFVLALVILPIAFKRVALGEYKDEAYQEKLHYESGKWIHVILWFFVGKPSWLQYSNSW